jgi:phosphinothricin acetyltransferase
MLIRNVDPDRDAAVLAALYGPYVTDTVASLEEVPPTEGEMYGRIMRISASYPYLVAEIDGEPVGFAYASPHRERAAYRWAADTTVYLDRNHHRLGIGRALYEQLFSLLIEQGVHIAHAGITLPNEASVGLHESLGFKPIGIYRRVGYKMGAWRDVGWWQLELVPVANEPPAEPRAPLALTNSEQCR